eukprot:2112652-Amphidinium_carterae.1
MARFCPMLKVLQYLRTQLCLHVLCHIVGCERGRILAQILGGGALVQFRQVSEGNVAALDLLT